MDMNTSLDSGEASSRPVFGGRLFTNQIHIVRGLRSRLRQLSISRSADSEKMAADRDQSIREYAERKTQMKSQQAADWRSAMTEWDLLLDKQFAVAERETLLSIHYERQQTKKLKSEFVQNKAEQKRKYENASAELKQKKDDACIVRKNARDNIKAKLDKERATMEQQMHECREWVGIRTGDTAIQGLIGTSTPESAAEVQSISDLPQVAKRFEEMKKLLTTSIARMQNHPTNKFVGSYWFLGFGSVMGTIAAAIAWAMGSVPLIISIVGVFSSILFTAIIHFAVSPLVSRTIRRMFPQVADQENVGYLLIGQGHRIADCNCLLEIQRLEKQFSISQQLLDDDHKAKRTKLVSEFNANKTALSHSCSDKRKHVATSRNEKHHRINSDRKPKLDDLNKQQSSKVLETEQAHVASLTRIDSYFQNSQQRSVRRWLDGCKDTAKRMWQVSEQSKLDLPDWDSDQFTFGTWPRLLQSLAWRIGEIEPLIQFQNAIQHMSLPEACPQQPWSVFFDVASQGGLTLDTHAECKETATNIVRNTLLRAVTSVPAGSLNITIIDPEGLGKQFSWLMALADVDPEMVNHRVWTQSLHIAEQLASAARHVEDVIQQSLRNRYVNVLEYNRHAGPMTIPYRMIVWSNFPCGLDDSSWQSLCSIMASGGRCGVGVILQVSDTYVWPSFADRSKLNEFGLRLKLSPERIRDGDGMSVRTETRVLVDHSELVMYPLKPELPPADDRLQMIMEHHLKAAAEVGKCIVPYESIAIPIQEQQAVSSAEGLAIPLGISDSGRVQSMRLGTGTAQHVLIAGKTGSGKSSMLHTMITSAAMKYSPDQLRLVLLDFKKGVEFQVYSEVALSHADIIGIESKREFGVSTLEYLDRVLHARGEAFRQWGVQDIPSLSKKFPQHAMPRILIVIDEFQELFVEDDKLSQQASMLMDRIVRQGRSFGMHLVLASQTLGGAYSLPRTTLSQMAVRIALQCDSSDAMLILSEDNTAAERLRHSGQAIYNDMGGRIESNQSFQVAFIEKNDQIARLERLSKVPVPHSPTTNALGRRIVFEGHKPAVWDEKSISLAISELRLDEGSVPMVLGDSVSIDPPVTKTLTRSAGRNIMVIGQDESSAASLLAGSIAGFCYRPFASSSTGNPSVVVLDGSRAEDESMRSLVSQLPLCKVSVRVSDIRGMDATMEFLKQELEHRRETTDSTHPAMLIAVVNLSRFRELRRNEEYSFGDDAASASKPDAVLANLLREGPALGMHVWLWADSAGTITRWVSRQSLRDIELRILMQMSASDSNQLIDSNAANRLDRYVVLIQDDIEGKPIKLRPFELSSVIAKLTGADH